MRRPNWSPAEDAILRRHYAAGAGPSSCLRELPMRTYNCIVQRASGLKLTVPRPHVVRAREKAAEVPKNATPPPYLKQLARDTLAQHERDRIAATVVKAPFNPGNRRGRNVPRKLGRFV